MSLYQFAPAPSFGMGDHPFATWQDGFTYEELEAIKSAGNNRRFSRATVGGYEDTKTPENIRVSKVTWLELSDDTSWLYDRLAWIAQQLNGQFYGFDLYGFGEHFQYTVYESSEKGHYDWHIDSGVGDASPRKLSLTVQLTDPSEYEGGEFEVLTGGNALTVEKKLGLVTVFPSYVLHRVNPVTKGTRISLVAWITGPKFK